MGNYTEGCLICGSKIVYFDNEKEVDCSVCGKEFSSNALCEKGHFVCDECHRKKGFEDIKAIARLSSSINPIEIADEMMGMDTIHMHGPEHHFLVAVALLTSYSNLKKSDELEEKNPCNLYDSEGINNDIIFKAEERALKVPGGICGFWGSCGAAIGAGIFISIITEATPLTVESWSKANLAVSNALKTISENGGPRCCKRNTFLAITTTVDFLGEYFDVHLEMPETIECKYYSRNNECKLNKCIYYKKRKY